MNKIEAIEKIQHSLDSKEPQIIPPGGREYKEYVKELTETLFECVIDPIKVKVVSSCAKDGDLEQFQNSVVWAIARRENDWLLTLDSENEFALAFGEDSEKLMMLGFCSPDALHEWWS